MPSPFYSTTPRLGLRSLLGTSNVSDIDAGFLALATDVENAVTGYKSGTNAARLAATNIDGLLWRETDTGLLYLGTGTTWVRVVTVGSGFLSIFSTASTAYTIPSGQFVNFTANSANTVTLPAPAANALVGVRAGFTTSAGSITVQTPSGSILGVGLNATSFPLSTPGAAVILQSDGTNWFIISGQQDSGWVALTLGSGISAVGTDFTPAARLQGDTVRLRGEISGSWASGGTLATLPVSMRPASIYPVPSINVWNGGSYIAQVLNVNAGGTLSVITAQASGSMGFDGISFQLN